MLYFSKNCRGKIIEIHDLEARDVDALVDYWVNESTEFYHKMGIDTNNLPTREGRTSFFNSLIGSDPRRDPAFMMVARCEGKTIAYVLFNQIRPGVECQVHLHIISRTFRKQGHASEMLFDVLGLLPRTVGVKTFLMEPSAENKDINKFITRFGLTPKKTYLKPAQGICREMRVHRYEVKSWQIHLLAKVGIALKTIHSSFSFKFMAKVPVYKV